MANRLDVSDQTAISMLMRNLISIIVAVAVEFGHTLVC